MNNPVKKIIDKYSHHSEFTLCTSEKGVPLLSISKGDSLLIDIEISPNSPEWYIFAMNRINDNLLMWDSHFYFDYEYDKPFEKAAEELDRFLGHIASSEIQIRERNTFFTKRLEFEILMDDEWSQEFKNPTFKWFNPDRGFKQIHS